MFYWVVKLILTPILRVLYRPWVEGLGNVPTDGPAILASNHLSFMDSIFLPLVVPRKITFLAKAEYFTEPGIKGRLKKAFFSGVGQVPIKREGGNASRAALDTGKMVLAEGKLLGMYPEGTRSPDGRLYRGRTGVARVALEAGVPVIPCAMIGMFEIQPEGRVLPKIKRVGVRIGKPLDFSRYEGMEKDRFVLRSITDEIMYELMLSSGQEYVDHYATKAKADLKAAALSENAAADTTGAPAPVSPPTLAPTDGLPPAALATAELASAELASAELPSAALTAERQGAPATATTDTDSAGVEPPASAAGALAQPADPTAHRRAS